MKVLFVSSANPHQGIDSLILNQALSLEKHKVEVQHFTIKGGFKGYLQSISNIRRLTGKNSFSLIHAHYGLCGLVSLLAFTRLPLVVSFMGSDLHGGVIKSPFGLIALFINKFSSFIVQLFANRIIVKSENLFNHLALKKKAVIIPNGIDLEKYIIHTPAHSKTILNLTSQLRYILFLGEPSDTNKNFQLLAASRIERIVPGCKILSPYPCDPEKITHYLCASDVLVLSSFKEGSPNVIKEAMACNCPVVSTDVGDVRWVLGDTEGCYICSYDPKDVAGKIQLALSFASTKGRTNGRERIIDLGLDSETIAGEIIEVYRKVNNVF